MIMIRLATMLMMTTFMTTTTMGSFWATGWPPGVQVYTVGAYAGLPFITSLPLPAIVVHAAESPETGSVDLCTRSNIVHATEDGFKIISGNDYKAHLFVYNRYRGTHYSGGDGQALPSSASFHACL